MNLGRLSIARFEQNSGTVPEFFHLLLESRRDPPVVALRLPPANGFDPSGIRCPELRFEGSLEDEGDLKTGWKVDSHKGWPQNSQSSGAGL